MYSDNQEKSSTRELQNNVNQLSQQLNEAQYGNKVYMATIDFNDVTGQPQKAKFQGPDAEKLAANAEKNAAEVGRGIELAKAAGIEFQINTDGSINASGGATFSGDVVTAGTMLVPRRLGCA